MRFFVKAVATGFAMSMGSALFKKVSKKIGLDGEEPKTTEKAAESDLDVEGGDADAEEGESQRDHQAHELAPSLN